MENQKKYDVIALGELLIDFTPAGISAQGNPVLEQNPGGAPCNVLSMLARYGRSRRLLPRHCYQRVDMRSTVL